MYCRVALHLQSRGAHGTVHPSLFPIRFPYLPYSLSIEVLFFAFYISFFSLLFNFFYVCIREKVHDFFRRSLSPLSFSKFYWLVGVGKSIEEKKKGISCREFCADSRRLLLEPRILYVDILQQTGQGGETSSPRRTE